MTDEIKRDLANRIRSVARESLQQVLEHIVATKMAEPGERIGGFLRVFIATDPLLGLLGWRELLEYQLGGRNPSAYQGKYKIISGEKSTRLMINHADPKLRHVSSWQSRDEASNRFAGAVIFKILFCGEIITLLIAFSGLPPEADEALGLLIGKKLMAGVGGSPAFFDVMEIAYISSNRMAVDMLSLAA